MTQTQMPAMFSRTGAADFPQYLKCMLSGPPKSGKTTFLGTVPNLLILDTEPHANNLQSVAHLDIPFKTIHSSSDLRQAQFILSQEQFRQQAAQQLGLPSIDAVAIDTMDTLQGLLKKERMREQKATQFYRDDWGWLKEEMTAIIESFTALPMHVFFIVHTKTKDIGTEEKPRTVVLPGLEGAIADQIAGMVGYSLLSFRKEEVNPTSGQKETKYFIRAEGDETYEFLGNRAAGRLPSIILPDFRTIHDAAMAGRPTTQHAPIEVDLASLQKTGSAAPAAISAPPAAEAPTTPAPAPAPAATPAPAQSAAPAPAAAAPAPAVAPATEAPAQNAGQPAQPTSADDEPVNAAAMSFVQRVYEAIGQPFPQDKIQALTMGQARMIVRTMKAVQQDAAEGKGGDQSPNQIMTEYLRGEGLLAEPGQVAPVAQTEAKVDGTIDEVKTYVGDELIKAQEAYDLEMQKGDGARKSLVSWLESKGVTVQTAVQNVAQPAAAPDQGVTPAAAPVDAQVTEEQGLQNVQQELGGVVVESGVNPEAKCEECGNPIDDEDLAELGVKRYGRLLCVKDYLGEGKKTSA